MYPTGMAYPPIPYKIPWKTSKPYKISAPIKIINNPPPPQLKFNQTMCKGLTSINQWLYCNHNKVKYGRN